MNNVDHTLKTDPEVFDAVRDGLKTFEIRFNDRDFKVGEVLILLKTLHTGEEMQSAKVADIVYPGKPLVYTGDRIYAKISYILKGPIYGLQEGWVILNLSDISIV